MANATPASFAGLEAATRGAAEGKVRGAVNDYLRDHPWALPLVQGRTPDSVAWCWALFLSGYRIGIYTGEGILNLDLDDPRGVWLSDG